MTQYIISKRFFLARLLPSLIAVVSCSPFQSESAQPWFKPCYRNGEMTFSSAFDEDIQLQSKPGGQALSLTTHQEKGECRTLNEKVRASYGQASIQFQGGDRSERSAEIISDPLHPNNKVLSFTLATANVRGVKPAPYKGRVQMNLYESMGAKNVKVSVRMYLHPHFGLLQEFPGGLDLLAISEWWNNGGWTGESFPFRISVNLVKHASRTSSPFFFSAKAQTRHPTLKRWNEPTWSSIDTKFVVPTGEWLSFHYEFMEGDNKDGRFLLSVERENGERSTIFDIRGFTHHPEDPNPNGITHINPLKLYTSKQVLDYVHKRNGFLQILWDDLKFSSSF